MEISAQSPADFTKSVLRAVFVVRDAGSPPAQRLCILINTTFFLVFVANRHYNMSTRMAGYYRHGQITSLNGSNGARREERG